MLKDIRIHLHSDEEQQNELEKNLAENVVRNYRQNLAAFKVHIPSLLSIIEQGKSHNISIFTNKFGKFNIVNYSNGLTLYDLEPEEEIQAQYDEKLKSCTYCELDRAVAYEEQGNRDVFLDIASYISYLSQPSLVTDINVLVVLGIGLGFHVKILIEQHNIKHLIIYEPEEQYFLASLYALDWKSILETAKNKGTNLYFQLNNDGTSLVNDIEELRSHVQTTGFYLYRHYNCDTFNVLEHALLTSNWEYLKQHGISRKLRESQEKILPHWNKTIPLANLRRAPKDRLFENNIEAFKRYVPSIANEFENYEPDYWYPVENEHESINVLSKLSLSNWYSASPYDDANINFDNFEEYPNKDGLILGYNGVKLKHYHHFKFVKKAEKLLKEAGDKTSKLPHQIKSLILFGIGPQLGTLFERHEVEKLFICEPNRDLFYASLYLINWAKILKTVDEADGRLYINVGDDGSNLFRDLLNQFYSVGPYILANTYFYQTYHNATMVHTISQLREQLQVVIAMGENFDHARYGIAHTTETISRNYPLLLSNPANKLSIADKDVPIFIVGNGPSLDNTIATIKSLKEKAIIISCGTALMPLYKNGITPDFHAEIEQNRSTYDWSCRIDDFEYLKQVDLLSCNGIHPDTCELFRNTYIAFKEGESSTVSSLKLLGEKNYEELQFAYPTVSNFVINLFTLLGFQQLYLFGIDLGFAEQDKHHSKQSGYYDENGEEKYSYKKRHNTNIVVQGNFRPTVFTKYEFKVSKAIIERTLAKFKVDCFNTSDGARIAGSKPLHIEDILLINTIENKVEALRRVKRDAFQTLPSDYDFLVQYDAYYLQPTLEKQLYDFVEITRIAFETTDDAERYTDQLKAKLLASYQNGKSLLFYYLYGTVNFANSAFSKLLYSGETENNKVARLNTLREMWLETLETISQAILQEQQIFDHVSSFVPEREAVFLKEQGQHFSVFSQLTRGDNKYIQQFLNAVTKMQGHWFTDLSEDVTIFCREYSQLYEIGEMQRSRAIVQIDSTVKRNVVTELLCKDSTIVYHHPIFDFKRDVESYLNSDTSFYHAIMKASWNVKAWLQRKTALLIIPKLYFVGSDKELSDNLRRYSQELFAKFPNDMQFIDFPNYIMVPKESAKYKDYIVDKLGNRGVVCVGKPDVESLFFEGVTVSEAQQQIKNNMLWWGFEGE